MNRARALVVYVFLFGLFVSFGPRTSHAGPGSLIGILENGALWVKEFFSGTRAGSHLKTYFGLAQDVQAVDRWDALVHGVRRLSGEAGRFEALSLDRKLLRSVESRLWTIQEQLERDLEPFVRRAQQAGRGPGLTREQAQMERFEAMETLAAERRRRVSELAEVEFFASDFNLVSEIERASRARESAVRLQSMTVRFVSRGADSGEELVALADQAFRSSRSEVAGAEQSVQEGLTRIVRARKELLERLRAQDRDFAFKLSAGIEGRLEAVGGVPSMPVLMVRISPRYPEFSAQVPREVAGVQVITTVHVPGAPR